MRIYNSEGKGINNSNAVSKINTNQNILSVLKT